MNLVILFEEDFVDPETVRLSGRRKEHVAQIHRADVGRELAVGLLGGAMGQGLITHMAEDELEMTVSLGKAPPPKLPINLVLALPRPKVLNRVIASATTLGVQRIDLINAWRVEKAYWRSPRLSEDNLLHQRILGLEQAKDTLLPELHLHRLLRPFCEDELPSLIQGTLPLIAHPSAPTSCQQALNQPITLAIGPEGGFIPAELDLFGRSGFKAVSMGARILRVETAVAALLGKLFS